MIFPDVVLALKLFHNAGITESDHQLALTACNDLIFETIKAALNQIFETKASTVEDDSSFNIKDESAFMICSGTYGCQFHRRHFPRVCAGKSNSGTVNRSLAKLNPSFNGLIARSRFCDSK